MKILIIGLPHSGRSTVAHAIAKHFQAPYIDAMSWIKDTFRDQKEEEHPHHYEDEYDRYLSIKRSISPSFITDHIYNLLKVYQGKNIIIDGITSPRDFCELFDYRHDVVVFLNRTDGDSEFKDHENIGVSVIRDYCFWLSSASLLVRNRWLEFNFKIPGDEGDLVKEMGSKNSVFIVRSIGKVITHLIESLEKVIK